MSTYTGPEKPMYDPMDAGTPRGVGRAVFASLILLVVGTLNVIYGIAAIDDSSFFVANAHFVISNLNTWGWIIMCLGVLQLIAAPSIWRGGLYGIWFGVAMGCASAVAALVSIDAYPLWSLAIFALDVIIIHGLIMYSSDMRREMA